MAKTSIYKTDEGRKRILAFYEDLLLQGKETFFYHSIETSLGSTFIMETGRKESPAILLLHGSGTNSAMWLADIPVLSDHFRVLAIDIIGECGKSSENRPAYKRELYAGWIREITENLGLHKVSIVGCSLGGWIALSFGIMFPEKTEKLILLATAGIVPVKTHMLFWILITSLLGDRGFKRINKRIFGDLEIDPQALLFASLVQEHFIPRAEALPLFDDRSLRSIQSSTLFIGGAGDCFYDSNKTAFRLRKNLDCVQCCVLDNWGHVLTQQSNRILNFLLEPYHEDKFFRNAASVH
ncbi:MAG TPA: alpha/beta hydrolase [Prolixibacteraceae bacterium]|nr:alpha/beta hydrolase [Prolixibacteraceae bacterium]